MIFVNHYMCSERLIERTEKEMAIFREHISNPKIIFDIGANVGLYTCFFARTYPEAIIYAFEPVKESFKWLEKNIELNDIRTAQLFNFGFFSEECEKELFMPKDREDDNTGCYSVKIKDGKSATLDKFFNVENWCKSNGLIPDLIKLDAEGCESEIIVSSTNLIEKVRHLIVEDNFKSYFGNVDMAQEILSRHFFRALKMRSDSIWVNKMS